MRTLMAGLKRRASNAIGWLLSSFTAAPYNFDASQHVYNLPEAIFFKPDGIKMYIVSYGGSRIFQYTLSTPWNLATAVYDAVELSTFIDAPGPTGLFFKSDGTRMFVASYVNNTLFQYTLSTPWDLSTAVYASKSFDTTYTCFSLYMKSDGLRVLVGDYSNNAVKSYALTSAWDISTASLTSTFSFASTSNTSQTGPIFFKDDGLLMTVGDYSTNFVHQFALTSAFDITTATPTLTKDVSGSIAHLSGITFKTDGTVMYLVDEAGNFVFQYTA